MFHYLKRADPDVYCPPTISIALLIIIYDYSHLTNQLLNRFENIINICIYCIKPSDSDSFMDTFSQRKEKFSTDVMSNLLHSLVYLFSKILL